MDFFYRVKRWHPERKGEHCSLLAQGRNGNRLIRFGDGFTMIVPFYAIRKRQPA